MTTKPNTTNDEQGVIKTEHLGEYELSVIQTIVDMRTGARPDLVADVLQHLKDTASEKPIPDNLDLKEFKRILNTVGIGVMLMHVMATHP